MKLDRQIIDLLANREYIIERQKHLCAFFESESERMNEIADWLINRVKQKDNYEQISILQTVGRHGLRPSCLRMIAKYYGKTFSVQQLREQSYIQRTGVNLLGISEAAASIGCAPPVYALQWKN